MTDGAADWLMTTGRGDRPTLRWSFTVDAPLSDVRCARETGEIVAADTSGGLYFIDRQGKVRALIRTRHRIRQLAWADTGTAGAALLDGNVIGWFDPHLQFQWTRTMKDEILGIAVDPYGTHVAIGQANAVNFVYSQDNKKFSQFETVRPVRSIQFLVSKPEMVVASEYGFVGRFALSGASTWTTKLWSTVGEMAVTGDGRWVFLAGFAMGIQAFDGQSGEARGTFICDGTVAQVCCGYTKRNIIGYTLERTLFCVDDEGNPRWHVTVPEDIQRVILSPLGDYIICGLSSGRIMRFDMPY